MNADEIFVTALDIADPAQRNEWLQSACAGDEELRREVDSLLAAHERIGDFLRKRPVLPGLAASVAAPRESAASIASTPELSCESPADSRDAATKCLVEMAGERIGRYKLLERIGEGGMGVVWMAEQEEPVRRRVALKIIKLGMDTREVIARFEAERQALALMDHPNIAKVFDGGATRSEAAESQIANLKSEISNLKSQIPTGRPYFVMELVRGLPITKYCDEVKMSTRQRLELFTQVCRAVQHAHQKGIIHRDLKPSNILVTEQDGRPVPKVIDFGIAKATEGRLTDKTLFTGFQQLMGTPAYMSPEQAGLGSLDIDTRSDTYSLGVVLYQLLTGHTPFDTRELLKEGYEAVLRTIREVDPPKPSTRLKQDRLLQAGSAPQSEIRNPKSEIDPDLDWIVMKCLEKDRNRRYETPNGLAADLERHLHDEPVTARPPGTLYRWQKFVRKHRGGVAAAAGFALLLTAATAVSLFQATRANREKASAVKAQHRAETQTKRAEIAEQSANENARQAKDSEAEARAVLRFFQDHVLAAARPEGKAGGLGREATIRAAVDAAEPLIAQTFTNQPLVEASIRHALGLTYRYLGDYSNAIRQLERTFALRRVSLGESSLDTLSTMGVLAEAHQDGGHLNEALALSEETLARLKAGENEADALVAVNNVASSLEAAGRPADAVRLLEPAVKAMERKLGADDPDTINAMNNLAIAYQDLHRFQDAVALLENALRLRIAKQGSENPDTLVAMVNLGQAYLKTGQSSNAIELLKPGFEVMNRKLGPDHLSTLRAMNNLARAYEDARRLPDSVELSERTLSMLETKHGPSHPTTITVMGNLARLYRKADRLSEALDLFARALDLSEQSLGANHADTLTAISEFAKACLAAKQLDRAETLLRDVADRMRNTNSADSQTLTDVPALMNNVGVQHMRAGHFDKAAPVLNEALLIIKSRLGLAHASTLSCLQNLAETRFRLRDYAAAESLWREWLTVQRTNLQPENPLLAEATSKLGECLVRQDKYDAAEPLLRESLAILEKQMPRRTVLFETQSALGAALLGQKQFDKAEPLLAQAYEGLKRSGSERASASRARALRETVGRHVRLYEAWGKPEQAAHWRKEWAEVTNEPAK